MDPGQNAIAREANTLALNLVISVPAVRISLRRVPRPAAAMLVAGIVCAGTVFSGSTAQAVTRSGDVFVSIPTRIVLDGSKVPVSVTSNELYSWDEVTAVLYLGDSWQSSGTVTPNKVGGISSLLVKPGQLVAKAVMATTECSVYSSDPCHLNSDYTRAYQFINGLTYHDSMAATAKYGSTVTLSATNDGSKTTWTATARHFGDYSWEPWAGATVTIGSTPVVTNASGVATWVEQTSVLHTFTASVAETDTVWGGASSAVTAVRLPRLTAASARITGSGVVGRTLSASAGTWLPSPVGLTYQWNRNGTPISGATGSSYTSTTADTDATITVTVIGNKPGYISESRTSAGLKVLPYVAAPSHVTHSQPNASAVDLHWSAPTTTNGAAITGYRVARIGTDSRGDTSYTDTVASSSRYFRFRHLVKGRSYTFKVKALTRTPSVAATAGRTFKVLPFVSAPLHVTRAQTSASTVRLHWSAPATTGGTTVTGYRVVRINTPPSSEATSYTGTVAASSRSFVFRHLVKGRSYTFKVTALTRTPSAAATAGATLKVLPYVSAPSEVTRSQTSASTMRLHWGAPATTGGTTITGYRVVRIGTSSGGATSYTGTVAASARSFSFGHLVKGRTYTFKVKALTSTPSAAATASRTLKLG